MIEGIAMPKVEKVSFFLIPHLETLTLTPRDLGSHHRCWASRASSRALPETEKRHIKRHL
jgi:hypothetical protein